MIERSWKWRRISVFLPLAVCLGVIVFLAGWGADTRLNQDLATGAYLLIGTLVGSYLFGAAWDDRNRDQAAIQINQRDPQS